MKKIYLLLAVCALTTTANLKAQNIKFGLKAGLNSASIYGKDTDNDAKLGLHIGGFIEKTINSDFAIQAELLYSQQGAKNNDIKANLNYINVPVLLKYNINSRFNLQAGPQLGVNIVSKVEDNDGNSANIEDVATLDFGLCMGAEYYFTQNIGLNARYAFGLTEIIKNSAGKNIALQIGMAYRF